MNCETNLTLRSRTFSYTVDTMNSNSDRSKQSDQIQNENHEEDLENGLNQSIPVCTNDDDTDNVCDHSLQARCLEPTTPSDDRKQAANPRRSKVDEKERYRQVFDVIDSAASSAGAVRGQNSSDYVANDVADVEKAGIAIERECGDETNVSSEVNLKEKFTTEPIVASGGPRRFGRPRASEPGVEFVRGRAPGARPGWYVQQLRRESMGRSPTEEPAPVFDRISAESARPPAFAAAELQESAPVPNLKIKRKRKCLFACITLGLLIGVAAGLGLAFSPRNDQSGSVDSTTRFNPFTQDCNAVLSDRNPSFLSQCYCSGNIYHVPADVITRYNALVETFMPTVFPKFDEKITSCSSRNQALVWLASGDGVPTSPTMRQRFLLTILFVNWKGPKWEATTGWLSADDECSWTGVSCNLDNEVVNISLKGKNLDGDLSSGMVPINSLTSLTLDQNSLHGTLPTEIVSFSNLQELSLQVNAITGTIPNEWGMLLRLTSLTLSNNFLKGGLPTALGGLSALQILRLSNNALNGTIPSELGQLSSLQSIALDNNTLTGTWPAEIGRWTSIETIDFSFNNFLGSTIPTQIGLMSSLSTLKLSKSGMIGTLPRELFGIKGLQNLIAGSNNLTGCLPTEVGKLPVLSK